MEKHKNEFQLYTSVARQGNDILFMGYDHEDAPVKKKIRFSPELFVESKNGPYKTINKKSCERKEFDTISSCYDYVKSHKDLFKLYGCSDYVRQFTGRKFSGTLKARLDLIQAWFFDIETEIGHGFPHPETALERISLITMYNRVTKKVHTWGLYSIDDPMMNSKQSEEAIASDLAWIKDHNVDYRMFSEEASMLKDFLLFIKTNRIDILSGWNSEFFDIPYLYNRIKLLLGEEIANLLSPWKIVETNKRFVMNKERTTYNIVGVGNLDLLDLYKKFNPGSKEEFTLGFICELELGETKVELPGEDFKDSYQNYWSTFVRYNIVDVLLLDKLDRKKQILDLCIAMAYMAKCNFDDVVSAMRLWESIIYNHFLDEGVVEDWEKKTSRKTELVGAFVQIPIPGFYKWAVSIDATSLYPMIMSMLNISPDVKKRKVSFEKKRGDKETTSNKVSFPLFTHDTSEHRVLHEFDDSVFDKLIEYVAANGCVTDKTVDGFMKILIQRMFKERKDAKNKMLDLKKVKGDQNEISALNMKQNALKVALNSLYGCLSMQYFKYFDNDLAEAVTMTGQMIIQNTAMEVNRILNRILKTEGVEYAFYSDTDSVYISFDTFVQKFCQGKDDKEIVGYLEKFVLEVLQGKINDYLDGLMSNFGVPKNIVTFKLEGIANNSIWLAKKRYISNLLYNEGVWYDPPEMKIMGMEIVRSSTPKFIKNELKKAVSICINGKEEELQEFIKNCKIGFLKRNIEEISFPRGCNGVDTYSDEESIYKSGTPIHVRAALMHNKMIRDKGLQSKIREIADGERIKYIHLKTPNPTREDVIAYVGKFPKEFDLEKYIDKSIMFDKGFLGPIEGVLDAIGWDAEEKNMIDL